MCICVYTLVSPAAVYHRLPASLRVPGPGSDSPSSAAVPFCSVKSVRRSFFSTAPLGMSEAAHSQPAFPVPPLSSAAWVDESQIQGMAMDGV